MVHVLDLLSHRESLRGGGHVRVDHLGVVLGSAKHRKALMIDLRTAILGMLRVLSRVNVMNHMDSLGRRLHANHLR